MAGKGISENRKTGMAEKRRNPQEECTLYEPETTPGSGKKFRCVKISDYTEAERNQQKTEKHQIRKAKSSL